MSVEPTTKVQFQSTRPLYSRAGFTLLEAVVGLGLLAILIATNMAMINSFFVLREQQTQKHEFYDVLNELSMQLGRREVCEAMLQAMHANTFAIGALATPVEIDEIKLPNELNPIIKKGQVHPHTLLTEKIILQLAGGPPLAASAPNAYLWLTLNYRYLGHPKNPGSTEMIGAMSGEKKILLEVNVGPKVLSGSTPVSVFSGTCDDYISKQNKQSSRLFCGILGTVPSNNGKCDLFESHEIRRMTCEMMGKQYAGRFCSL